MEVDAIPPDSAARTAFVEFLRLTAVKHYSVTHEGTGFLAAAIRSVIGSAHALARPACKHSVQSTVRDAARWHAAAQKALGRNESADLIEGIVTSLRALHKLRYPSASQRVQSSSWRPKWGRGVPR